MTRYAVPAPVPAPQLSLSFLRGINMKIAGIDPKTLCNEVLLVLPRGQSEIVFRAKGLSNMDEFDAVCPHPKPPGKFTKDGWIPHTNDPTYQQVLAEYAKKRLGYIVIRSLEPSEIEWDTVKRDDPRTWPNWESDLTTGGLSQIESNRVLALVMEANALDEAKLEKARESFLRGQAPMPEEFSSPLIEQPSSPSGGPANG
jgi:hypothetical protein